MEINLTQVENLQSNGGKQNNLAIGDGKVNPTHKLITTQTLSCANSANEVTLEKLINK